MTFLITGATGDVGSRVVEQLIARGERPRVFVRDSAKAQARFGDGVEVFVGDLGDAPSLSAALEGVDALFLVNTGPSIPDRDEAAANAARAAGVNHLVKLSSLDVEQGLARRGAERLPDVHARAVLRGAIGGGVYVEVLRPAERRRAQDVTFPYR